MRPAVEVQGSNSDTALGSGIPDRVLRPFETGKTNRGSAKINRA